MLFSKVERRGDIDFRNAQFDDLPFFPTVPQAETHPQKRIREDIGTVFPGERIVQIRIEVKLHRIYRNILAEYVDPLRIVPRGKITLYSI